MGLEFVDITLRLQREFEVCFSPLELQGEILKCLEASGSDVSVCGDSLFQQITVQHYFDAVCQLVHRHRGRIPADSWPRFVRIIEEVTGLEGAEIVPTAFLIGDLGIF